MDRTDRTDSHMKVAARLTVVIASSVFLLALAGAAAASSITVSLGSADGCVAECLNADWSLTASTAGIVDSSAYNMHVSITAEWPDLTFVDEDGAFQANYVTAIEFGLPGDILAFAITTPTAGWSEELGPLSGNGCGGHNGNFACSEGKAAIAMGGSMTWEIDVRVGDIDTVLTPKELEDFHIGALVSTIGLERKDKSRLLSINPIPEPSAALCFGVGALVCGQGLRRRA